MAKLRTFIIEDDIIHASQLEMLLEELGYAVVGTTDSSDDALNMILATNPDLLFVDVMINGQMDGIELVERLQQGHNIPVIFITSLRTEETVSRAMKLKPYAFILKPFEKITIQTAIELAIIRFTTDSTSTAPAEMKAFQDNDRMGNVHIFIKANGKLDKIGMNDIFYIEVRDKICLLALANEERKVRIPLSQLERKLDSNYFLRVHRSFVVNLNAITQVDWANNSLSLGQYKVPLGRYYRENIKARLDRLQI